MLIDVENGNPNGDLDAGNMPRIAEMLDNPDNYNGESLADPLEREDEGGSMTKAKFFWNDGKPVINSFAHGNIKYTFARFPKIPKKKSSKEKSAAVDYVVAGRKPPIFKSSYQRRHS